MNIHYNNQPNLKPLYISLILLLSLNFNVSVVKGAENDSQQIDSGPINSDNQAEQVITATPMIWSIDQQELSETNNANETFWVEATGEQSLVLKYWAKGRKFRGNVILLHAQGENADHPRITQPLAIQLSQLGWQVFVPNLPIEDFPRIIPESTNSQPTDNGQSQINTDNQSTSSSPITNNTGISAEITEKNNREGVTFFEDSKAYQNYVSQLLMQIVEQAQPKSGNFILAANQNSAYWILDPARKINTFSQVILLEPQLPDSVEQELESYFTGQSLPVYTFTQKYNKLSPFTRAFERKLWRSNFQRVNQGIITNKRIEIEDVRLAKIISGWVEVQQKNKH